MKKLIGVLFLFFCCTISYSQDLIIKKDSSKIRCRIIKQSADSIFYSYYKENKWINSVISKSDVTQFYVKPPPAPPVFDTIIGRNTERFHFGFNVGTSNPIGEFSNSNPKDTASGFAKRGISLNLSFVLKVSRSVGLTAYYIYQKNNFEGSPMAAYLQSKYGGTFAINGTNWNTYGFLGGFYFEIPVKNVQGLFCDMNFLGGMPLFNSPDIRIMQNYKGAQVSEEQVAAETNAFAFVSNIGLRYRIAGKFFATGRIEFLMAKPNFTILVGYSSPGYPSQLGLFNYTQYEKSINAKIGVTYILNGFSSKKRIVKR